MPLATRRSENARMPRSGSPCASASIGLGSKPKSVAFSSSRSRRPWNIPQSMSMRIPPLSRRNHGPVTSLSAQRMKSGSWNSSVATGWRTIVPPVSGASSAIARRTRPTRFSSRDPQITLWLAARTPPCFSTRSCIPTLRPERKLCSRRKWNPIQAAHRNAGVAV